MHKGLILGFMLGLLLIFQTGSSSPRGTRADRFDVNITIMEGGSLSVVETVPFTFIGGGFDHASQVLSQVKSDGIRIKAVKLNDQVLPWGRKSGHAHVKKGQQQVVTWYFESLSDEKLIFGLEYQVLGAVRRDAESDVLIFQPLPHGHAYPILTSTVTVAFPPNAILMSSPEVQPVRAQVTVRQDTVIFSVDSLLADSSLVFKLYFRPGSLISFPPQWQRQQELAKKLAPSYLCIGIGIFLCGSLGLLIWARRYRQAKPPQPPETGSVEHLPGDLPPGLACSLIRPNAMPNVNCALATLLALLQRGVIKVSRASDGKKGKAKQHCSFVLAARPDVLPSHEQGLLIALYKNLTPEKKYIRMPQITSRYYRRSWHYRKAVSQDLTRLGLLDLRRQRAGQRMARGGSLTFIFFLGGAVFFLTKGFPQGNWPIVFIPLAVAATGLVAFTLGEILSPLSSEGVRQKKRWQAYCKYLQDLAQTPQASKLVEVNPEALPYAAGFGLGTDLARAFSDTSIVHLAPRLSLQGGNSEDFAAIIAALFRSKLK